MKPRIVRPAGAAGRLPVILWCGGSTDLLPDLADRARAAVVTAAPMTATGTEQAADRDREHDEGREHSQDDKDGEGDAAVEWIVTHGGAYGLDPSRIAVAGHGTGGARASAVARRPDGPAPVAQVLLCPRWPGAPSRATPAQLAGLPPALVVVAATDPHRDEGETWAARLRAAGVPVTAVRYQGTGPGFPADGTPAGRAAIVQAGRYLREALQDPADTGPAER